ncbi:uncharacterized protein LOC115749291 isoform X2 [Rhodamnia argentea]|uniref:Uncharacterized protein LOC115749291 isoform X2 n=1 Tax=Rhodamnia argentea TaxID=178133 RepID=A0A8B8Q6E3_9MYRT|nr:uncharacterized protein LOC115749291 isoform X2 [Rhodamnia argentea]
MGDHLAWSPEANGDVSEDRSSSSLPSSSSSSQAGISAEFLQKAEEVTRGIIAQIQPNFVSEERRAAVIDYVQRLIRNCLGLEVFPFGSVPLKTYLPDGDIDLTAFGGHHADDSLAGQVCSVLQGEEQNEDAEFVVKDVQLIWAEVKLVKCIIQNIVVDISFNQLGGLCTLCFLEQVDHLIDKDHLFKRSIILVKAWCYYESRILGAHHGLISTYALETLVLYIFHLFHSSLDGPLAVLYKFLDYYSKFDWDKYGVSLNGPVLISSLPEIVVETMEHNGELLLSKDFLKDCVEHFSVPSNGFGANARTFVSKHLNIVDPLKENNNLGRSVSKGSFFRIRSAFSFGVRKLEKVLSDPEMDIADELSEIFSNTLDRHGNGQRPDVQDLIPVSGHNNVDIHREEDSLGRVLNEVQQGSARYSGIIEVENPTNSPMSDVLSSSYGQANELATFQSSVKSNGSLKSLSLSSSVQSSLSGKAYHAPHLYFSRSSTETGETRDGDAGQEHTEQPGNDVVPSVALQSDDAEPCVFADRNWDENQLSRSHAVPSPAGSKKLSSGLSPSSWTSDDTYSGYPGVQASCHISRSTGQLNSLSDLSGDHESNMRSLQYGRWCYGYALSGQVSHVSPSYFPQFPVKNSWEVVRRSMRQPLYNIKSPIVANAPFGMEDMSKPRGTGTYFPNTNHYKDRNSMGRGRNHAPVRSPRSNGRTLTPLETNFSERSNEFSQTHGKSWPPDLNSGSPIRRPYSTSNGSLQPCEGSVEFGSFGHQQLATPLPLSLERGRQPISVSAPPPRTSAGHSTPGAATEWPSVNGLKQDRISLQSYHLKDEDDFPPLTESAGKG